MHSGHWKVWRLLAVILSMSEASLTKIFFFFFEKNENFYDKSSELDVYNLQLFLIALLIIKHYILVIIEFYTY